MAWIIGNDRWSLFNLDGAERMPVSFFNGALRTYSTRHHLTAHYSHQPKLGGQYSKRFIAFFALFVCGGLCLEEKNPRWDIVFDVLRSSYSHFYYLRISVLWVSILFLQVTHFFSLKKPTLISEFWLELEAYFTWHYYQPQNVSHYIKLQLLNNTNFALLPYK